MLLNIDQAAEQLGVTPRFVRRLVAQRRITYHKIGKYVRFHPDDIDDWIAENRIEATNL